tara:strand:+ start:14271 stop:14768 length:498 start_codon:yes stop_codon:yes gene_type:complete
MVLPIRQDDQYMGMAELSGLLRVEKEHIVLEYSLKDEVLGMFNSDLKVLKIPLHSIDDIIVKKKWFSGRFIIYLNRLPKTDKSLHIKENTITFKIKKKELERAESVRSSLRLRISEDKLQRLEDEDNQQKDKEIDFEFYSKSESSRRTDYSDGDGLKNMLRDSDT